MSDGVNDKSSIVADDLGVTLGRTLEVFEGSLKTDLYWSWSILAIIRGSFDNFPLLSNGPTFDLLLANLLA